MPRKLALESLERRQLLANDLVAFANQLADRGIQLYGAAWSEPTTLQRQLFEDGGDNLPFVEASTPDRNQNQVALDLAITAYPTWIRESDGAREEGVLSLEAIAAFAEIEIPQDSGPTFESLGNQTVLTGSPLHLPIDAYDPNGGPLTVTVTVENPSLLEATVLQGNRSIRIDMQDYGDMVFELFEQRAPIASGRVIELAENDFYKDVIFHRVINDFVIQGGDPTGTGSGGSSLGDFDDDFHPDLQHNRGGILSFAKSNDDTNDSQFFVTEVPTRFLDFNHSVFGQLVEGEDVRQAISEHAVSSSDRPTIEIAMQTVSVFNDQENSVVMLKAIGTETGSTNVTFTVTNSDGQSHTETIAVSVQPDTANSQPFLATIPEQRGPAGEPHLLQLDSTDIENDAVEYLIQLVASDGPVTTNVSEDGLVTITPTETFMGTVDLAVAVRPAAGTPSEPPNAIDIQRFNVVFDDPLLFPDLDLLPSSDSGSSDSDNLTNAESWEFVVSPTLAGDIVELVVDGEVVATETASGESTSFSFSAANKSGQVITSAAITRADVDLNAPSLTVVLDRDAPSLVRDGLPVSAATGQSLVHSLRASDLDTSFTNPIEFELVSGPDNASIDNAAIDNTSIDNGSNAEATLTWVPETEQLGDQTFEVRITDAAGNSTVESFTITAYEPLPGDQPIVEIQAVVTDLSGNEVSTLEVGQPFLVELRSTDRRHPFDRTGVYATFVDALFDSTLLEADATNPIVYPDEFTLTPSGTVTEGLIDELGAASSAGAASNRVTTTIAIVQMQAVAAGTAMIELESADESGRDILLFGSNIAIPIERVAYLSTSIEIVASWHRETNPSDVNGDQTISPRDALTIINLLAVEQGSVFVHEVDQSQFAPELRYDVIPDGRITPRDALFVINEISLQSSRRDTSLGEAEQDPSQYQLLRPAAEFQTLLNGWSEKDQEDSLNTELW